MRFKTIILSMLLATPAFAGPLSVSDAWFRALPANLPAGGYFVLHNNADSNATLTGASSPACGMLMLHKSETSGGMGMMDMVMSVSVPAHGVVKFAPGGYHLMCDAPSMKPGGSVPVTLEFADGTRLDVEFAVKNAKGQ
ncbi:MAG TPA: copper chaperone PCu(A)C [Rhizomicrobium sp.]|nr:copper chaperone PCu(A)C [Rhizomicrobium sp.]